MNGSLLAVSPQLVLDRAHLLRDSYIYTMRHIIADYWPAAPPFRLLPSLLSKMARQLNSLAHLVAADVIFAHFSFVNSVRRRKGRHFFNITQTCAVWQGGWRYGGKKQEKVHTLQYRY